MPTISDRPVLLLDTHVWLWLEMGSHELSQGSRQEIADALGDRRLRIAAISLWEVALLTSRRRLTLNKPLDLWLEEALAEPGPAVEPLSREVAVESCQLPEPFHRDPADRIIVATSRIINAVVLTRDRAILDYAAQGHVTAIAV